MGFATQTLHSPHLLTATPGYLATPTKVLYVYTARRFTKQLQPNAGTCVRHMSLAGQHPFDQLAISADHLMAVPCGTSGGLMRARCMPVGGSLQDTKCPGSCRHNTNATVVCCQQTESPELAAVPQQAASTVGYPPPPPVQHSQALKGIASTNFRRHQTGAFKCASTCRLDPLSALQWTFQRVHGPMPGRIWPGRCRAASPGGGEGYRPQLVAGVSGNVLFWLKVGSSAQPMAHVYCLISSSGVRGMLEVCTCVLVHAEMPACESTD